MTRPNAPRSLAALVAPVLLVVTVGVGCADGSGGSGSDGPPSSVAKEREIGRDGSRDGEPRSSDGADLDVVVDADPLEVVLDPGERLGVRFSSSASIGDNWLLVSATDVDVADVVDERHHVDDPEAEGSGGTVTFVIEAGTPGVNVLQFVNCFQGECSEDNLPDERLIAEADLEHVEVTVVVRGS